LVKLAERLANLPKAVFLWVGGGELEDEFERYCAVRTAGRILRQPFRDDIPELIAAADVGCLVSEYEGLPVFMLECLQLGRPFLSTDAGDIARVLEPSRAGIVAGPPGNLDALERAARRLCDDELRAEMGRNAAAAAGDFSPTRVAAEVAAVLAPQTSGDPFRRVSHRSGIGGKG
jgi:glycosyltransferase involved in cell wall biosynthesis